MVVVVAVVMLAMVEPSGLKVDAEVTEAGLSIQLAVTSTSPAEPVTSRQIVEVVPKIAAMS
ncbi:MAG: hypothetical protein EB125_10205 [Betaproteobacteria bacterium]|nr:hypothetical protein [Betaproteobacteria bacterium]